MFQALESISHVEKVLQKVNEYTLKVEDLLTEGEALVTATQGTPVKCQHKGNFIATDYH